LEAEGLGLFDELGVLAFEGARGDFEGFRFVIGLPGGDQGIYDPGQFVHSRSDPFGLAQPPCHPPGVFPHFGLRAVQPEDVHLPVPIGPAGSLLKRMSLRTARRLDQLTKMIAPLLENIPDIFNA